MSRGDVAMDSPIVLCIDDRPQALEFRKATLESRGYCVKTASSGYTAMKMLEETSASTVLLEYKQEGMDAEAVACYIKRRFPMPADHPAISVFRDARANPVVGGWST
jgi:response regulator RpfG family c-di-GMP phosphodiesterase